MHPTLRILLRQFSSPAILILLVSALIYGLLGNSHDALVLLAIVIPSGLLTFVQEFRAEATLRSLENRLETKVLVLRNGKELLIRREEILAGDEINLHPGEVIPADMELIESENLSVDQSSLTGESFPKAKNLAIDRNLYMGTYVVSGSCQARVTQIGRATKYGAMEEEIAKKDVETTFEKGVRNFGLLVARAIFLLVALVFAGNLALDRPLFQSLLFSLALAIGLTPQMLPVIISVCLSAGARHLAREKVLIRRLDAIEDLGTLEVLCTDKTGTLTTGELRVNSAIDFQGSSQPRVLALAYENAVLQKSSANFIDAALIKTGALAKVGKKIKEIDFNFDRRRVSILKDDGEIITKGAFREVLGISRWVRQGAKLVELDKHKDELIKLYEAKSAEGYKIIAVASKYTKAEVSIEEAEMIFEGIVLIEDPAKADAKASLAELTNLGVELILISGDSAAATRHIAGVVGISEALIITGEDLNGISDVQLEERLQVCRLFAEIDPTQKARIVEALRRSGKSVGFLGDGINDAIALKLADVSISVDDAVDVAKGSSAIVLLEKNLAVIADGIRIGRRTFENTMKYVRITISASFGNVLSMAIASLFLPFLPMLPTQILLLNFLSDLPAVAISGDRVDGEDLERPSHWTMRGIGHFMVFFGLISTVFDLILFFVAITIFDGAAASMRSAWFATSLMTEVVAILILRTRRISWRSRPGSLLTLISALVLIFAFTVPALGVMAPVGLPRTSGAYLALVIGLTIGFAAALEIAKARLKLMERAGIWV